MTHLAAATHPALARQQAQADEFVAVRHDIHRHPELGFEEVRTSELVAERLAAWGYTVTRGIGGTGLVGQLKRGSGSKRLGIRGEMDALPIQEATGLPYASQHAGRMHACGHDGHTTMVLAAAKQIAEHGRFSGALNLIFQPAEEGLAGARRMMDDGLFERFPCDAVFAMHNMPGYPQGQMLFRDGAMMASSDNLDILIEGRGGHGAMPHEAADPVVAGAAIVMGLQSIVSRNVGPLQSAVITVGAFQAGEARNVIAQTATLRLSVRTL
ncbi:MAG TPA: amidohydrolase, partial [Burkholderiaceae bacterium]|nr:amidohydrolase [Burkholderiaceae bacterium]